jgi:hypothetical protein
MLSTDHNNWGTAHEIAVNKTQILFLKATTDLE